MNKQATQKEKKEKSLDSIDGFLIRNVSGYSRSRVNMGNFGEAIFEICKPQ